MSIKSQTDQNQDSPTFMGEPAISKDAPVSRDALIALYRSLKVLGCDVMGITNDDTVRLAASKLSAPAAELIEGDRMRLAWTTHLEAFIGPGALPGLHRSFEAGTSPGGAA